MSKQTKKLTCRGKKSIPAADKNNCWSTIKRHRVIAKCDWRQQVFCILTVKQDIRKQKVFNMALSLKKASVKQVYCTQRSAMFVRMCMEGTEHN